MRPITIRPLIPDDWRTVCALHDAASLVELAESGISTSSFRPMEKQVSQDAFFNVNTSLVACDGLKIVGFVAWRDRNGWQGSGYLSWLYIDPIYHRQGIGTGLFNEARPYLGDQAWTLVKQGNHPAITLYKKFGMQVVPRPQENDVRMALPSSKKFDPSVPNFGA